MVTGIHRSNSEHTFTSSNCWDVNTGAFSSKRAALVEINSLQNIAVTIYDRQYSVDVYLTHVLVTDFENWD